MHPNSTGDDMANNKGDKAAAAWVTFRTLPEYKAMIMKAAARYGLQLSSYMTMLLVRDEAIPNEAMEGIKRCPAKSFAGLYKLLTAINRIGINCKQLAAVMPDVDGLHKTHQRIMLTASIITDKLYGESVPESVRLDELLQGVDNIGKKFNAIVRSVNMKRPQLADLPETLIAIRASANFVITALNGELPETAELLNEEDVLELAMEEMFANMRHPRKDGQP